jgi:DNA-binding transcriptional ArsR family regulator
MRPPDSQEQAVAVFAALIDPTRRALLDELARAGPATVTDLARRLPISRQAVAKHLDQLAEAGLISSGEPVGRRHPYRLEPAPIRAAQIWLATLANRWDGRLTALERALDATATPTLDQGATNNEPA